MYKPLILSCAILVSGLLAYISLPSSNTSQATSEQNVTLNDTHSSHDHNDVIPHEAGTVKHSLNPIAHEDVLHGHKQGESITNAAQDTFLTQVHQQHELAAPLWTPSDTQEADYTHEDALLPNSQWIVLSPDVIANMKEGDTFRVPVDNRFPPLYATVTEKNVVYGGSLSVNATLHTQDGLGFILMTQTPGYDETRLMIRNSGDNYHATLTQKGGWLVSEQDIDFIDESDDMVFPPDEA